MNLRATQAAKIAMAILEIYISESDRKRISNFSECHDFIDANIALYGAFCGSEFREPDFGSGSDTDFLNQISRACDFWIKGGKWK